MGKANEKEGRIRKFGEYESTEQDRGEILKVI